MVSELGVKHADIPMSGIRNKKGPFKKLDDFLDAVRNADAGDMIILANDTYDVSSNKNKRFSNRRGTADNPIVVSAEEVGKVILKGSSGYKFKDCEYLTWYGFTHKHDSAEETDNISFEGGKNNRFARCEVALKESGNRHEKRHWLHMKNCKSMTVDHCYFHDKNSRGQFCNVRGTSDNPVGQGPVFEYNRFEKHTYVDPEHPGDSGGEAIQMGESTEKRFYFRAVVRYNYFEECNGDPEIVTNKSSGNLYFNNSFVNNLGNLTLRHGDSTAVLGNYFEACGLRIGGAFNLIANNHFTLNSADEDHPQRSPLVLHNGDDERPKEGKWERVIDNKIILNTFANGDGRAANIVYWGDGDNEWTPTGNEFRGNIITAQNGKLLKFANDADESGNTIKDNIASITGSADDGDLMEEMAKMVDFKDLKLARASDGIYRLQSEDSKACGLFQGTPYRGLTKIDIDGEERGPNTDAGCDQFSTASTKPKKRITSENTDVGPDAEIDLGDSPDWSEPANRREDR